MANKHLGLGILAIVLVFGMAVIGCGDDGSDKNDGGIFTLTDIPSEFNGKYVLLEAESKIDSVLLYGTETIDYETESVTFSRISKGNVKIPMWIMNSDDSFSRYFGNDTVDVFILIGNVRSGALFYDEAAISFDSVKFLNGTATKKWNDGDFQLPNQ